MTLKPKRLKLIEKLDEKSEIDQDEIDEKDLPLLANVDEVRVLHYIMQLEFNFDSRTVQGILVLFLEPQTNTQPLQSIILDSCSIICQKAYLLKTQKDFPVNILKEFKKTGTKYFHKAHNIDWFTIKGSEVPFLNQKWSLKIFDLNEHSCSDNEMHPSVVRIHYKVLPTTPSLQWLPTKGWKYDGGESHYCVLTPACPVNNRGLFPCQEPPSSMATWECFVTASKGYQPLLTSDDPGEIIKEDIDVTTTYFHSSMDLPMSTFALIIGQFFTEMKLTHTIELSNLKYELGSNIKEDICKHEEYPCRLKMFHNYPSDLIFVRLFSLDESISLDLNFFRKFLSFTIKSIYKLLGTFPFSRVDFVIVPKYFSHLGLSSPNLIFLSPSLFVGESPLYHYRLPHEITHYWFGLLIGALHWLDEYLSEGFATFMEDILYIDVFQEWKSELELLKYVDTKACMSLITLQNELQNVASNSQILSPDQIEGSKVLKNGLDNLRPYSQVHYLKGYFLLKHLMYLVGKDEFLKFLRKYVWKFHGQLVTSNMFLEFYYNYFSNVLNLHPKFHSLETLKENWLKNKDLPEPFHSCDILSKKVPRKFYEIFPNCEKSLVEIFEVFEAVCSKSSDNIEYLQSHIKRLSSNELQILLEKILSYFIKNPINEESRRVYERILSTELINWKNYNPEIIHRICELILLNKDITRKQLIIEFLEKHQSLGVYLYGELMITEKRVFQTIAKSLYLKQYEVLTASQKKIVHEMIF